MVFLFVLVEICLDHLLHLNDSYSVVPKNLVSKKSIYYAIVCSSNSNVNLGELKVRVFNNFLAACCMIIHSLGLKSSPKLLRIIISDLLNIFSVLF